MIPETIVLDNIEVPTFITIQAGRSKMVIAGGPYPRTMKGEFLRDTEWAILENPPKGMAWVCKDRIFEDHYFLYRSFGPRGKVSPEEMHNRMVAALNAFMQSRCIAVAA